MGRGLSLQQPLWTGAPLPSLFPASSRVNKHWIFFPTRGQKCKPCPSSSNSPPRTDPSPLDSRASWGRLPPLRDFGVAADITACPECEVRSGPHAKKVSVPLTRPQSHLRRARPLWERLWMLRAAQPAIRCDSHSGAKQGTGAAFPAAAPRPRELWLPGGGGTEFLEQGTLPVFVPTLPKALLPSD